MCCDESGGVVDDLIAYLKSDDDVFLIPNAANTAEVVRAARGGRARGHHGRRPARDYGVIAVQGTEAATRCSRRSACRRTTTTCPSSRPTGRAGRSSSAAPATPVSAATSSCRAGTTRRPLWDALAAALEPFGGMPCGLGARDTLRTEMGYPLHGQDLSLDITPVQARRRLGGRLEEGRLLGQGRPRRPRRPRRSPPHARAARDRSRHPAGALRGQPTTARRSARSPRAPSRRPSSRASPWRCWLPASPTATTVSIDVRGRGVEATVVKPPFVQVQVRES